MKIAELVKRLEEIREEIGDVDVMAEFYDITEVRIFRDYEDNLGNPIGDVVNLA